MATPSPHSRARHLPLDCSCAELDTEDLAYGCSGFMYWLHTDLTTRSLDYLRLHYPELTFGETGKCRATPKPKGHALCKRFRGRYRWADWRTVVPSNLVVRRVGGLVGVTAADCLICA